ncbi:MAG TPA: alkyl sulfatase dimerization domain-containing protein [Blastocatellia bacterium]|nr:alkyl sulfatase dimerization domain-containing protein [Blastocatellia bacterium]
MDKNPKEPNEAKSLQDDKLPKEPSIHTIEANQKVAQEMNWAKEQDYADARKGFIATLTASGTVTNQPVDQVIIRNNNPPAPPIPIWNLEEYQFLIGTPPQQAPYSVNPSLWRQAQINMYNGLFKVTTRTDKPKSIYQVRAFDLSNMTIVEGETGIIVIDPLISTETAKAALNLYYDALQIDRTKAPVKAVIYTHSHIDHYGGVNGVVTDEQGRRNPVPIYAPDGFLDHAVSENVYAGSAMARRAIYMYGSILHKGIKGQVDSGLGKTTSIGQSGLIPPTINITQNIEQHTIDGVEVTFMLAPDTEAPAEMLFHFPQFKALCEAEDMTHNLHNLYSLRGAQVRDAAAWWKTINTAIQLFGNKTDVLFAQHHWPMWKETSDLLVYLKKQRDLYKYILDQSLRMLNHGRTMIELSEVLVLPQSLSSEWYNRGYYGTVNHDSKAVYQRYLGWYDANPATLHSLPPVAASRKYVEYMGGASEILKKAHVAYAEGDYRWVVEVVNHVIFAAPDSSSVNPPDQVTAEAKLLQADALEQLGYQAESGPWRNVYLMGADELRHGVSPLLRSKPISEDVVSAMTLDQYFDYMGLRFNAPKAEQQNLQSSTSNWIVTSTSDPTQYYALEQLDFTLPYTQYATEGELPAADVTLKTDRTTLNKIMSSEHISAAFEAAVHSGEITVVSGHSLIVTEILNLLDIFPANFNIVTPRQEQDLIAN